MKYNFKLTKNENIRLIAETVAFLAFAVTLIFIYILFQNY